MPRLPKSIALSALLSTVLAAPTAAQNAPEPLPVETLLSLSSAVGGETPRWAPDGERILLGGANLRLLRAEGGAISELPLSTGGSGHFLASAEPKWSPGRSDGSPTSPTEAAPRRSGSGPSRKAKRSASPGTADG